MYAKTTKGGRFVIFYICMLGSQAFAQDCERLLVPDITYSQRDISTQLSYLSVINASNYEEHKRNASAGAPLPIGEGIIQASANYDDFSKKRASLYARYGFNYASSELSTYYSRQLPGDLAGRYVECLRQGGLAAKISRVGKSFVEVVISWHPFPRGPISVSIDNHFEAGGAIQGTAPGNIKYSEEYTLNFSRLPDQEFRFNANVGGTTASIFVPKYIENEIQPVAANIPNLSKWYFLVSAFNGWTLNVYGARPNIAQPLCLAPANALHKWRFKAVAGGAYEIGSSLTGNIVGRLTRQDTLGDQIVQGAPGDDRQTWLLEPTQENRYILRATGSDLYIARGAQGTVGGPHFALEQSDRSNAEEWLLSEQGDITP